MQELKLNGHEIHSLQELREHFESNTIRNAFADGTLEKWLRDRYYEREADAVAVLLRQVKKQEEPSTGGIANFLDGFLARSVSERQMRVLKNRAIAERRMDYPEVCEQVVQQR